MLWRGEGSDDYFLPGGVDAGYHGVLRWYTVIIDRDDLGVDGC